MIPEGRHAFYLLAISIPFVISVSGLRGLLEAHQRFGIANAVKIPMGIFTYLGPVMALPFFRRIDAIVAVLVIGRVVATMIHFHLCRRLLITFSGRPAFRRSLVGPLVRFGGWMTVTNIVSPLMVYLDRFLIGGQISMRAVAFYVTPYEMVTKLGVIPNALIAVLFPAFSSTIATEPDRAALLFDKGVRYIYVAMFPVLITIVTMASPVLNLWLGADFASNSSRVMQCLGVGVFVNGMAAVPFAFLQGAGRPDKTAKLHFAELPIYLTLLWWAVQRFGIDGVAVVWVGRVSLDAIVLFAMARSLVKGRAVLVPVLVRAAISLVLFLCGSSLRTTASRSVFLVVVLAAFIPAAWRFVLGEDDRAYARARIKAVYQPNHGRTRPNEDEVDGARHG
jgi:O-antigen/teichoic acid export membrane protein